MIYNNVLSNKLEILILHLELLTHRTTTSEPENDLSVDEAAAIEKFKQKDKEMV